jgi:hypothetical protein
MELRLQDSVARFYTALEALRRFLLVQELSLSEEGICKLVRLISIVSKVLLRNI